MKQTFLIRTQGGGKKDFYRVGVKKLETAKKYLKGWRDKAIERELFYLYRDLTSLDATYQIIETPDGYHEGKVLSSGLIRNL